MQDTDAALSQRSAPLAIRPEWIDYNGHLNLAYYQVLFDGHLDTVFEALDLGQAYLRRESRSFFAAEVHIAYKREVKLTDKVCVGLRLIDFDEKRLHLFFEMHHAQEGWLAATSESLSLHVDMERRKVAPMTPEVLERLAAFKAADAHLPLPPHLGKGVTMKRSG